MYPPFCRAKVLNVEPNVQDMSDYVASLDYTAKKRYVEKLKVDGSELKDPYSIAESQWTEDMKAWPEIHFGDIYTYLIDTKGIYTKEKLKAYKSLEAYNYFFNGYVRTVLFCLCGDFGVLKAKVNPSQRSAENCQEAWVALSMSDGSVKTAHCTCMAG